MKHDDVANAESLLASTQNTLNTHQGELAAAQAAVDAAQAALDAATAVRDQQAAEIPSAENAVTQAQEALEAALALPNDGAPLNLRRNTADNAGTGPGYHWMGPSPSGPLSIYLTHEEATGAVVEYKGHPETPWPADWTPAGTSDPTPFGTRWHITESALGGRKLLVRVRGGRHASSGAFAPDEQITINVDAECPYVAP